MGSITITWGKESNKWVAIYSNDGKVLAATNGKSIIEAVETLVDNMCFRQMVDGIHGYALECKQK